MLRGLVFLALLVTLSFGYPVTNAPVIWDIDPPQQGTRSLTSQYLGECVCDMTRGMCDTNCCCDPDCSEATVSLFQGCVPEQYGYPDVRYCYEENSGTRIKRINGFNGVYLDKQAAAPPGVCIVRTNLPGNLYKYFQFPSSTKRPTPPLSNTIQTTTAVAPNAGDPLPTAKYVSVGGEAVFRRVGNFQIPVQLKNGQCSDFIRNVGFLIPLQGVSCTLNGEQICSRFPVESLTNLFVYRSVFNQTALAFLPVNINILSPSGSLIGRIDALDTFYNGTFNSLNTGTDCTNAMTHFSAEFIYNATSESTVTGAGVNVTVDTVPLTTFVPLVFEAAFVKQGDSLPEAILPATPGYIAGGALRGGTLVSSAAGLDSIVERKGGFAVPSGGRSCSLQSFRTVAFMHSVISSGCTVSVSEGQLRSICSDGNAALVLGASNSTYADGYPSAIDYVAVTNDALANDTSSWIPIEGIHSLQFGPGSYDNFTRRCSGMVVGLSYQFVVARAGAEYNPQDLVSGAFVEPIIGSWRIRNETDFSDDGTTSQNILFRVSFSRYDPNSQATIRRRVKAPPILPRLDESIFYPFRKP